MTFKDDLFDDIDTFLEPDEFAETVRFDDKEIVGSLEEVSSEEYQEKGGVDYAQPLFKRYYRLFARESDFAPNTPRTSPCCATRCSSVPLSPPIAGAKATTWASAGNGAISIICCAKGRSRKQNTPPLPKKKKSACAAKRKRLSTGRILEGDREFSRFVLS